jgi:hypothetical protein
VWLHQLIGRGLPLEYILVVEGNIVPVFVQVEISKEIGVFKLTTKSRT